MTLGLVTKDPSAVLDYSVDWTVYLDGDTITTSSWTSSDPGLVIDGAGNTQTTTTVRLAGGTLGARYTVTNRIVMNSGQVDERSFDVQCGST